MTIYVGNLSYRVNEETLAKAFSEVAPVQEVKIIHDEYSGRSKGFGFVSMHNDMDADRAIQAMNGKTLEGQNLNVHRARTRQENLNQP